MFVEKSPVKLSGIFVVLRMPENQNEFKNFSERAHGPIYIAM